MASCTGALSADAARKLHMPVMLIQGGIHAGEIDGKDAGLMALRELLGQLLDGILGVAQPARAARRDAFLEGLRHARAGDS